MPPAFALSQDQTLRFIQRTTSRPSAYEPPCTHYSHRQISQPSQNNQTPSQSTQSATTSQQQHPGADRASHPTKHQQPLTEPPAPQKAQSTAYLSPAPSHPHSGQPRTKHFQNRCNCQRTQPSHTGSPPPTNQGDNPHSPIKRNHLIGGGNNLVTFQPPVNPTPQRREGASMPLGGGGQPPFRHEMYQAANSGTPRSIGVCG